MSKSYKTVKLLPYEDAASASADMDTDITEKRISIDLASSVIQKDTQKLKAITLQYPIRPLKSIPTPLYDCADCVVLHDALYNRYIGLIRNYESKAHHEYYEKMKHSYRFHHVVNHMK